MEFRILGPFEVVQNGGSLTLGGAQQRALLAVLVVHRGELLSADRLIDELWGERAPATAAKALQGYVSHLRKALGDGVIVTQGRGYVLAVEAEQVDAGQFEALAGEGRRAFSRSDPARARERLGAALQLWRGEPLAEFTYEPFAQNEIARLHEAHEAVLEDRIDADLALGRDAELIGEIDTLVAANPLRERLRGQLMTALYRSGRQADALAVYRQTSELLRDELGLEPGRALKELERMVLEQDAALEAPPIVSAGSDGDTRVLCPFKGLAHFDRADAEYFCGRERAVSGIVGRVVESGLIGILGPSGIGKSSLLRAGVLPALSAGALPGSAEWRQVLLRPGEHPCTSLATAVGDARLNEALMQIAPGDRIVIAIDQMEELFTLCERERERSTFLEQIAAAGRDHERRALVLCSLRADFYGRIGSYPAFAGLLTRSHVLVAPMDRDELARAIEQPAARAGLVVERPLVEALVSEVAGEAGGLPLLSTTLLELWREREADTLTFREYRRTGGVRGAVARLAEHVYARLDERERRVARVVMLRLVRGDDETLVRCRVALEQLERVDGAQRVLTELTDARLLTVGHGHVELSHEALISEWPRYREWLDEDRASRRLHAHLTEAAAEWNRHDRDPGELYRGARLAAAQDWIAQHSDQPNQIERDFIAASQRGSERDARRLRAGLAGVALLLLVALIAGAIAVIQKRHATTEARVALAGELGAEAVNEPRIDRALLLAREAVNLDPSPQAQSALFATLLRSPAVIGTFAVPSAESALGLSPDGRTLIVGDDVGTGVFGAGHMRFYDTRTHAEERPPLSDFVASPVYSSDGSRIAYIADEHGVGEVMLRDAHTLAPLSRLPASADFPISDLVLAPDGGSVYYEYQGNLITTDLGRWSLRSRRLLSSRLIGSGYLPDLVLRLVDGAERLVVVGSHAISLLDASSLRLLQLNGSHKCTGRGRDQPRWQRGRGRFANRRGLVYRPVDRQHRRGGAGHDGGTMVVYAPDGRTAVTVGDNGKAIVWNPRTATRPRC